MIRRRFGQLFVNDRVHPANHIVAHVGDDVQRCRNQAGRSVAAVGRRTRECLHVLPSAPPPPPPTHVGRVTGEAAHWRHTPASRWRLGPVRLPTYGWRATLPRGAPPDAHPRGGCATAAAAGIWYIAATGGRRTAACAGGAPRGVRWGGGWAGRWLGCLNFGRQPVATCTWMA